MTLEQCSHPRAGTLDRLLGQGQGQLVTPQALQGVLGSACMPWGSPVGACPPTMRAPALLRLLCEAPLPGRGTPSDLVWRSRLERALCKPPMSPGPFEGLEKA